MTRADDDELQGSTPFWNSLMDAVRDDVHHEDSSPASAWKTLLDAACWVACVFATLTASLYLLMLVVFGDPGHHPGIFALGCLATITGYASSFGITACSLGRGPWWLVPSALLFWLSWWAFSLPQARGFIH